MKIAVVGAQNVGKTTFINDFVGVFSDYTSHVSSLKNIANEKGLQLNQMTSEQTQLLIMQHLYNQISENKDEKAIFDRCLIDNYVYTYCAYLKGGS
jgi:GTPase SAR1 family protein